jgi:hypothetical protein
MFITRKDDDGFYVIIRHSFDRHGYEDDYYHTQMFTENELEEIADHLYAVVKRVRKEQEDDEKFLDDQIKECERQEDEE